MPNNAIRKSELEGAINAFLDTFAENPLLHRVEHSWHVELFNHLKRNLDLKPIETAYWGRIERIQKEWPQDQINGAQENSKQQRPNIDIVVLDQDRIGSLFDKYAIVSNPNDAIEHYKEGLLGSPIDAAIEVGVNASLNHFLRDIEKTSSRNIKNQYIVHLHYYGKDLQAVPRLIYALYKAQRNGKKLDAFDYIMENAMYSSGTKLTKQEKYDKRTLENRSRLGLLRQVWRQIGLVWRWTSREHRILAGQRKSTKYDNTLNINTEQKQLKPIGLIKRVGEIQIHTLASWIGSRP